MVMVKYYENSQTSFLSRWQKCLQSFCRGERVETVRGWTLGSMAFARVKRRPGFVDRLLSNSVLCVTRSKGSQTRVYRLRFYGLTFPPETALLWLLIFASLALLKPEGVPLGPIAVIVTGVVAGIAGVTWAYSRFSPAGRRDDAILRRFWEMVFREES